MREERLIPVCVRVCVRGCICVCMCEGVCVRVRVWGERVCVGGGYVCVCMCVRVCGGVHIVWVYYKVQTCSVSGGEYSVHVFHIRKCDL